MTTALNNKAIYDHISRPAVDFIYWLNGEMRYEPVFICNKLGDYAMQQSTIHKNVMICYNPKVKNHFKDLDNEVDRIYRRQLVKSIYDQYNQDGRILLNKFLERGVKSEDVIRFLEDFGIRMAIEPVVILHRVN